MGRLILARACLAMAIVTFVAGRATAQTQTISINSLDLGWWQEDGHHDANNKNYAVGNGYSSVSGPFESRNWFVFNLSGVTAPVQSARLMLFNPATFGYSSADPTETYSAFDVSTPIASLRATGTAQTGIFNDLGTGASYGTVVVSPADMGKFVVVDFNAAGLAYLNANRGGQVAVAGAITTLDRAEHNEQSVFHFTPGTAVIGDTKLEVVVPEPAAGVTAIMMVTLGASRRLRRARR